MEQFLLLLVLAGGCHAFLPASETKCDANQDTCSPVVGGSVSIKLLNNATGYKLQCVKGKSEIFSLKRGNVKVDEAHKNRTKFVISTGTLKMTYVERNDTGQYRVESYDPNGKREKDIVFNLQVKEDIFSILVIAGIAVGGVLLIVLVICCICCRKICCRTKSEGSQAKSIYEFGP